MARYKQLETCIVDGDADYADTFTVYVRHHPAQSWSRSIEPAAKNVAMVRIRQLGGGTWGLTEMIPRDVDKPNDDDGQTCTRFVFVRQS